MVPGREGRQPLDVHAEQSREGVGLGVAEGRELLGDALDRAVALAELDAGEATGSDGSGGGGEAVRGQRGDEGARPGCGVGARGGEQPGIPGLESGDARAREVRDGVGADRVLEVVQGLGGQRVVVRRKGLVAGVGDDEGAGGAAAAAGPSTARVVLDDTTLLGQGVEVTADRGCGQAEPPADLRSGDRPVLGHDGQHPRAGALLQVPRGRLVVHVGDLVDKHHTIVT